MGNSRKRYGCFMPLAVLTLTWLALAQLRHTTMQSHVGPRFVDHADKPDVDVLESQEENT
jgi:hypothetical protein